MGQSIWSHTFDNGLVLAAESMPWVESAAFSMILPAGCCRDPDDRKGLANITCEMVQRGCGERDNRQFVEDLDRLGSDRSSSVSQTHTNYGAAMLADNLNDVLSIYADLVRWPVIPRDEIEEGRLVCLQELQAIEDDLAQRMMQELRRQTYADPWGRTSQGERAAIENVTIDEIRSFFKQNYVPQGTILSVAGKIDWRRLKEYVEQLFGDWSAPPQPTIATTAPPSEYGHIEHDSNQMQIGIAYATVPYRHPLYFHARGAVGVLSDGMSSRLFTEVRENRGLCYAVYATYHSLLDEGRVFCYAGTSTDRAQETLDVMLNELTQLADGINEQELYRLKARVKSALIMQQESSSARSSSMAADWYHLGRIRTLDEINGVIDGLTCASINAYLAARPPANFTIATLGANPLETPVAVS